MSEVPWQAVTGITGIVVAIAAVFFGLSRIFVSSREKSLSVREHVEFKESTRQVLEVVKEGQNARLLIKTFDDWRQQFWRDLDRIESTISALDQTKPTTAELDRTAKSLEARMVAMEEQFRTLVEKIASGKP